MMPMSDNFFSNIRNSFHKVSIVKFLIGVFFVVILAVLAENITGYIFFMKMEKKVTLLKELNELSNNGVSTNNELKSIYLSMVSELEAYDTKPLSINWTGIATLISLKIPEKNLKFLSGSLVGFLIVISGLFARKEKRDEWLVIIIGGLLFGILLGYVAVLIPTIYNPWVNYLAVPSIQIIVVFVLLRTVRKKHI